MKKSFLISAAIAGATLLSPTNLKADDSKVMGKCHGVNGCGGQGQCATKSNSCKGHNSCKGTGWTKMSKAECDKLKGKFEQE